MEVNIKKLKDQLRKFKLGADLEDNNEICAPFEKLIRTIQDNAIAKDENSKLEIEPGELDNTTLRLIKAYIRKETLLKKLKTDSRDLRDEIEFYFDEQRKNELKKELDDAIATVEQKFLAFKNRKANDISRAEKIILRIKDRLIKRIELSDGLLERSNYIISNDEFLDVINEMRNITNGIFKNSR